ncbi:hypothetical protein [Siphonobacter sp. SORGH_AS_1065]|uniref:hypothetical protein n=1 Tax=Siphonobacter sp. SORGH_AS_1065 TaxID=3041795 RepID=UPI00278906FE|nr:hypothetical protein [Siphonobacter sp. SORGH_AS_1065]MDQ1088602.1 hypothetical protein [Siphonobacter sp. SORGH_AS_1065]
MHVSLHIEGDLTEIAKVLTAFSGSGATVEPAIQAKSAADDEPVKAPKQPKPKQEKAVKPAPVEEDEEESSVAESDFTHEESGDEPLTDLDFLKPLIKQAATNDKKRAKIQAVLADFNATALSGVKKEDYKAFYEQIKPIL